MRKLLALSILCCVFACNEKVIEPPADLIAKDKMLDILYDLAIINSAKGINSSILEQNGIDPMGYIYEKYGIDSVQFVKSDVYYASVPEQYEELYQELASRIKKDRENLEAAKKSKQDSLKKSKEKKPAKKISGK